MTPPDLNVLRDLKRRVDEATRPCRGLDARIEMAFHPKAWGCELAGVMKPGVYWTHQISGSVTWTAKPITTSIDSAVALAERSAPDWIWTVRRSKFGAIVSGAPTSFGGGFSGLVNSGAVYRNEALATISALLAAMITIAQHEQEEAS